MTRRIACHAAVVTTDGCSSLITKLLWWNSMVTKDSGVSKHRLMVRGVVSVMVPPRTTVRAISKGLHAQQAITRRFVGDGANNHTIIAIPAVYRIPRLIAHIHMANCIVIKAPIEDCRCEATNRPLIQPPANRSNDEHAKDKDWYRDFVEEEFTHTIIVNYYCKICQFIPKIPLHAEVF